MCNSPFFSWKSGVGSRKLQDRTWPDEPGPFDCIKPEAREGRACGALLRRQGRRVGGQRVSSKGRLVGIGVDHMYKTGGQGRACLWRASTASPSKKREQRGLPSDRRARAGHTGGPPASVLRGSGPVDRTESPDPNAVGACRRRARPGRPEGHRFKAGCPASGFPYFLSFRSSSRSRLGWVKPLPNTLLASWMVTKAIGSTSLMMVSRWASWVSFTTTRITWRGRRV